MVAILTGDIVHSRSVAAKTWLAALKNALVKIGEKANWEIFRGDSFQIQSTPQEALIQAIFLKASIKAIKGLDVRIALGIGEIEFSAKKITESNGEAFINSGEKLDELKENRLLMAIKSPWPEFDYEMNVAIRLALIAMDNWSQASAEMIKLSIEKSGISQLELAELSGKSQSTVSEALKRARFAEILELDGLYRKKISGLIKS
jgi:predicted XRE-type DNA-binding protein